MIEAAESIGDFIESIFAAWKESEKESVDEGAGDDSAEEVRQFLFASDSPTTLDSAQILGHLNQAERDEYNRQLSKIKAVDSTSCCSWKLLCCLIMPSRTSCGFLYGSRAIAVSRALRRFLQVLTHVDGGQPFRNGSGRLSWPEPSPVQTITNLAGDRQSGGSIILVWALLNLERFMVPEANLRPQNCWIIAAEFMADG